jgi:phosphoglycolate phosphatase
MFDCDGTLVDSQHSIVEAMRLTFQSAGLTAPERPAILGTAGLPAPEALKVLAPSQPQESRDGLLRSHREWCSVLRRRPDSEEHLFQEASSLLLGLAAREDVILGIATGKSRRGVMRLIEQNNLHGVFSTIQTAGDAPSKPHPGMLLQAMEETGVTPEATVMIGDTSYDMMMASHANVAGVGVAWGYHTPRDLQRAGARTVARSFPALEHILHAGLYATAAEAVA